MLESRALELRLLAQDSLEIADLIASQYEGH